MFKYKSNTHLSIKYCYSFYSIEYKISTSNQNKRASVTYATTNLGPKDPSESKQHYLVALGNATTQSITGTRHIRKPCKKGYRDCYHPGHGNLGCQGTVED